jgi:indoleacetamide hydrolase
LSVEQVAAQIASKDVKGTYDGLVVPRKPPAPDAVVDAEPAYKAAMAQARPVLLKHVADTFARTGVEAPIGPTTPRVAVAQGPEASSLPTFLLFIATTTAGAAELKLLTVRASPQEGPPPRHLLRLSISCPPANGAPVRLL